MRNMVVLAIFLAFIVGSGFGLLVVADWLSERTPILDIIWYPGTFILWVFLIVYGGRFGDMHWPHQRSKPPGYVGKFRRPDGTIVHVARLADGRLTVVSEEAVGVVPHFLPDVTGRELLRWTKLATTPDRDLQARIQ